MAKLSERLVEADRFRFERSGSLIISLYSYHYFPPQQPSSEAEYHSLKTASEDELREAIASIKSQRWRTYRQTYLWFIALIVAAPAFSLAFFSDDAAVAVFKGAMLGAVFVGVATFSYTKAMEKEVYICRNNACLCEKALSYFDYCENYVDVALRDGKYEPKVAESDPRQPKS